MAAKTSSPQVHGMGRVGTFLTKRRLVKLRKARAAALMLRAEAFEMGRTGRYIALDFDLDRYNREIAELSAKLINPAPRVETKIIRRRAF
jgi:hypothetical protein